MYENGFKIQKKRTKKEKWYKKLIQLKIVTKYVDLKNKNRPFFKPMSEEMTKNREIASNLNDVEKIYCSIFFLD